MTPTMMTAATEKRMSPLRTMSGEAVSARKLKAAPVLVTLVMRRRPGMTTCARPTGMWLKMNFLVTWSYVTVATAASLRRRVARSPRGS